MIRPAQEDIMGEDTLMLAAGTSCSSAGDCDYPNLTTWSSASEVHA